MRRRQIAHMDIVADAGPVGRGVVVAEDGDVRARAGRGLQHQRDQVCLGVVLLARLARCVGARGVEIAQRHRRHSVGCTSIPQDHLAHQLGAAVGIDRLLPHVLDHRQPLGQAVGRAAAGKDDRAHVVGTHRLDERHHGSDVVAVVQRGLAVGFADIDQAREVDHGLRPMALQHRVERDGVVEIAALERPPLHRPGVAGAQVVVDDRRVTGLGQRLAGVRADIARASCDQDLHCKPLRSTAARTAMVTAGIDEPPVIIA